MSDEVLAQTQPVQARGADFRAAPRVSALLAEIGRRGPFLLAAGVLLGLAWPAGAEMARPWMPYAVFGFVLGAALRVDMAELGAVCRRPAIALGLPLWVQVGAPLVVAPATVLAGIEPDLAAAMVLTAASPAAASAVAASAMLGLNASVAMTAFVLGTLGLVATLPLVALAMPLQVSGPRLDLVDLVARAGALGGGAFLAAATLRACCGAAIRKGRATVDGLTVVALLIFACGSMAGVSASIAADPARTATVMGLAYAAHLGLLAIGAGLFVRAGLAVALAAGIATGNRGVSLIWTALGEAATPQMGLYFACTMLPMYTVPAALSLILTRARGRNADG